MLKLTQSIDSANRRVKYAIILSVASLLLGPAAGFMAGRSFAEVGPQGPQGYVGDAGPVGPQGPAGQSFGPNSWPFDCDFPDVEDVYATDQFGNPTRFKVLACDYSWGVG